MYEGVKYSVMLRKPDAVHISTVAASSAANAIGCLCKGSDKDNAGEKL